ncbi:MAG: DUF839 domain-containing protein [Myxococcales bacterium]|nr:DUF839 domain-containing protein [Myxococcales bacterium]
MDVGRRALLKGGAATLAAAAAGRAGRARAAVTERPLVSDPRGVLDLPEGFSYSIVQRWGIAMDDGYRVPARPDAMGCFPGGPGELVLMRNHEMLVGGEAGSPYFPGQPPPPEAFDPKGTGGVTRLVLDAETLKLKSSNLVLAGTYWNCAGGHSPWGWLSCEETSEPGHGYVFLCDPKAEGVAPARRIGAYGRMRHEAATVHPETMVAYLTEDRPDACFYRFVPDDPASPFEGKLQALRVRGKPRYELGLAPLRRSLAIDWVDLPQPLSDSDDLRLQAQALGAARVRRGEGLWLAGDTLYFCATAGGPIGLGQVLRVQLTGGENVEVVAHSENPESLNMPDNITVSPGGQVYVAEDGMMLRNHIRRITPEGRVVDFARNALSASEFCGICFSPDGGTMFANLQGDGLTLAIRGPFDEEPRVDVELGAAVERAEERGPDYSLAGRGLGTGLAVIALAALAHRRRVARK